MADKGQPMNKILTTIAISAMILALYLNTVLTGWSKFLMLSVASLVYTVIMFRVYRDLGRGNDRL